jgi:hypothetical protein
MSWLKDFLIGSQGEIDWDELAKMVQLVSETNRTDRTGIFTGWEWERDAEGNPLNRQVQTINPAFQGAVDRLGMNAGAPANPYTSPSQFSEMLDAKMANQMDRQGIPNQYQEYQQAQPQQPWQPNAERPGLAPVDPLDAFVPPPPGEPGAPVFEIEPGPGVGEPPAGDPNDPLANPPGYHGGLPYDYYNDKGNVRRKYRPGNRNYVGDEALQKWRDDPDYRGPDLPADYYNDKGNIRRKYRGQEYYSNPNTESPIATPGDGLPADYYNDKGNVRRRYRTGG